VGQKVNPISFRLGITEESRSRWYANKREFSKLLVEDFRLRAFIKKNYGFAALSKIEIERSGESVKVTLFSARPGLIIGRKGQEVENLKQQLNKLTGREVEVQIQEVPRPELSAQLVAEAVKEQLERRSPFRRAIKRAAEQTMDAGAKGVRIRVSGRLGGAEMSRMEQQAMGSIPLHTLRAKIDYGFTEAHTTYGRIGVKAWVCTGEQQEREVVYGLDAKKSKAPQEPEGASAGLGDQGKQG
jgi:small subunit ribosomal protein S3